MIKNNISNQLLTSRIEQYSNQILENSQRIFTALDRDPDSPTYGSFDRDYWHYKIRDFSSLVLHQASLSVDFLCHWEKDNNIFYMKPVLEKWVLGSLNHWCNSQLKNGSFNEYYPHEEGYPPTAFSLYATSLLILEKKYKNAKILKYIEKSAQWILNNPELKASNQEAIGLCAVYLSSLITNVTIDQEKLRIRLNNFFLSQSDEGWFPEYNGPDIGYLSVTIDALWDYYKYSKDERALKAMKSACDFIELFLTDNGNIPVMINSRNTDYIVPYGIFNLAYYDNKYHSLFYKILKKITSPYNFLATTDDRYLCHYVYTSSVRAINALEKLQHIENIVLNEVHSKNLDKSGILIYKMNQYKLYVNYKKGGVLYLYDTNDIVYTNHGYRYYQHNKIAVTHWLTSDNLIDIKLQNESIDINIDGHFIVRKWLIPTPLKHIILRFIAYTLGNKLIPLLKNIFIFGDKKLPLQFHRQITVNDQSMEIIDTFHSHELDIAKIAESPYYSMRHVSSAFRFTPDELLWQTNNNNLSIKRENNRNHISFILEPINVN